MKVVNEKKKITQSREEEKKKQEEKKILNIPRQSQGEDHNTDILTLKEAVRENAVEAERRRNRYRYPTG